MVAYDGNGNIKGLVNAADGTISARYDYGPFGELIRQTGPMSKANPIRFSTKFTDDETDLLYYGYRYYNPSTGRWLSRDPIVQFGGGNLYGMVGNNAISQFDLFGLKDYKVGSDDPTIKHDTGAGVWNSKPQEVNTLLLEAFIEANIGLVWIGMPDASAHLMHYFGSSGNDYTIRLQNMIDDVPSAKDLFNREIAMAQAYVESLPSGTHQITSGSASSGYDRKDESWNWFYAVGGYSAWGKGTAISCGDSYTLEFEYKFDDRYNWDVGKSVTIFGITVTDAFMGEFHRQGLAKEFNMNGSVKKTVKWKKGGAPTVTDGWDTDGDR